jgi:hypothetical protein
MRAFLIVLGVLLVGLAITGCGGDDDQQASAPTTGDRAQRTATDDDQTAKTAPQDRTTATDEDRGSTTADDGGDDSGGEGSSDDSDTSGPASFSEYKRTGGDDEAEVRTAVIEFHRALAAGNGDKACELLSNTGRKALTSQLGQVPRLKGKSCGAILTQLSTSYPATVRANMRNVTVTEVFVHDNSAFAKYRTGKLPLSVLPLEREDGRWGVGALGGAPANRVPLG